MVAIFSDFILLSHSFYHLGRYNRPAMPIYSTYIQKNKLILSVWQKNITLPDWLSYTHKLISSLEYQQSGLLLVDLQAAKLGFSLEEMRGRCCRDIGL